MFLKNMPIKPGYSHVVIIGTNKNGVSFGQIMLISLKIAPK